MLCLKRGLLSSAVQGLNRSKGGGTVKCYIQNGCASQQRAGHKGVTQCIPSRGRISTTSLHAGREEQTDCVTPAASFLTRELPLSAPSVACRSHVQVRLCKTNEYLLCPQVCRSQSKRSVLLQGTPTPSLPQKPVHLSSPLLLAWPVWQSCHAQNSPLQRWQASPRLQSSTCGV